MRIIKQFIPCIIYLDTSLSKIISKIMKIAFLIYQYSSYENDLNLFKGCERVSAGPALSSATQSQNSDVQPPIPAPTSSGGVERYVSNLSRAFLDIGHEVHIFCHKKRGMIDNRLIFHHVPALGFWSPLKIWSFAIMSMRILKKKQADYDIIQGFGKTLFQDVLRMGGGCHLDFMKQTYPLMKNPFLKILITMNPRHLFNLLFEWTIFRFRRFKRVICNSRMCKMEFVNRYRIQEDMIDVIYNGVDAIEFSPLNKKASRTWLSWEVSRIVSPEFNTALRDRTAMEHDLAESILILFVGSGFRRKGLRHLIEALGLLDPSYKVRLIVAGRGRFEGYKRLGQRLGIMDRIIYIGETDNVKGLYDACDIFVFPTEYDAFPNVCLEAMAMELPVIVSSSSGIAEIIDDGIDGFIVNHPVKAKDIAKRIEILLNEDKRRHMAKLARKKALNFTVQSNAEKTLELYKEIRKNEGFCFP